MKFLVSVLSVLLILVSCNGDLDKKESDLRLKQLIEDAIKREIVIESLSFNQNENAGFNGLGSDYMTVKASLKDVPEVYFMAKVSKDQEQLLAINFLEQYYRKMAKDSLSKLLTEHESEFLLRSELVLEPSKREELLGVEFIPEINEILSDTNNIAYLINRIYLFGGVDSLVNNAKSVRRLLNTYKELNYNEVYMDVKWFSEDILNEQPIDSLLPAYNHFDEFCMEKKYEKLYLGHTEFRMDSIRIKEVPSIEKIVSSIDTGINWLGSTKKVSF